MRPSLVDRVAERLAGVRHRIAEVGGDPDGVKVVAVTKGFGVDAVVAARRAGLDHLGENYAADLIDKARAERAADGRARAERAADGRARAEQATDGRAGAERAASGPAHERPAVWHFLGAVQRNKVARLAPYVAVWEAIDRAAAADAVAKRAPGVAVMVQVNVAEEAGKHGCPPAQAGDLVGHCRQSGLDVTGLMAVGPEGDRERTRATFRGLAALGRSLDLRALSMGMSDDFDLAVSEGATTIRLGRALFGPRPTAAATQR